VSRKSAFTVVLTAACLAAGPMSESAGAQGRGRGADRGSADRASGVARRALTRQQAPSRQLPRSQQEPAFARGYDDGYRDGEADGKRGDRYDPADSREYRNGDQGYANTYGSRDAYRNNYRAGFRQGYEAGYRDATR
jgi:flagellar biosynthesis/type III secretory pathway protein FliH